MAAQFWERGPSVTKQVYLRIGHFVAKGFWVPPHQHTMSLEGYVKLVCSTKHICLFLLRVLLAGACPDPHPVIPAHVSVNAETTQCVPAAATAGSDHAGQQQHSLIEQPQPPLLLQLQHHVPQQHEDVVLLMKPVQQYLAALCVRLPQQESRQAGACAAQVDSPNEGHGVSQQHVSPEQASASPVTDCPVPQTARGAQALLEACKRPSSSPVIAATASSVQIVVDTVYASQGGGVVADLVGASGAGRKAGSSEGTFVTSIIATTQDVLAACG